VNATTPALIIAAAGVGLGHAVMPDHWLPLALVGRSHRYSARRVARLSGLAGIAHVLVSLLLGGAVIAVGLELRATVENAQDVIVGAVLIATGLAFTIAEVTGRGHGHSHDHHADAHGHHHHHHHDHHEHEHHEDRSVRRLAAVVVPFGAAASPDLTILPVFLAASAIGAGTAIFSLVAFAVVTISTIVALTLVAFLGGYQLRGAWLDRWGNMVTAATLVIIGVLVVTRMI
jgi:hypothetical protein